MTYDEHLGLPGRWLTDREYSVRFGVSRQTLANWRFRDGRAGLSGARPGYPVYRRFGRAIRYWAAAADLEGRAA